MTATFSQDDLQQMAARWLEPHRVPQRFRIQTDTTDFFRVDFDDVVILDDRPFLIRHNLKESRYGLDEDIKYWVKSAVDLTDGRRKIIKLVFFEKFVTKIAGLEFECFRSPAKEARILALVSDLKNFMHGYSAEDEKGNIIRILNFIKGKSLARYVTDLIGDHQTYFLRHFPALLDRFIESVQAIRFLHENDEKHGDVRRDHILIDQECGDFRWIDFDYNYRYLDNPYAYDLFGLGNILIFLAGKGDVLVSELQKQNNTCLSALRDDDLNIVFNNRVANLKKIYPYIPKSMNQVLLQFSKGAHLFYDDAEQLLDELEEAKEEIRGTASNA
jgi:hypothetical protein